MNCLTYPTRSPSSWATNHATGLRTTSCATIAVAVAALPVAAGVVATAWECAKEQMDLHLTPGDTPLTRSGIQDGSSSAARSGPGGEYPILLHIIRPSEHTCQAPSPSLRTSRSFP